MPAEYSRRIIRSEHPFRVWRKFRGMKAADLARVTGVSASCLSDIEAGRKSGSGRTLMRLAEALRIDMEELAREQAEQPGTPDRRRRIVEAKPGADAGELA